MMTSLEEKKTPDATSLGRRTRPLLLLSDSLACKRRAGSRGVGRRRWICIVSAENSWSRIGDGQWKPTT